MNKNESIASERYSKDSWLPPWTIKEHQARYNFASYYVAGKVVVDCACGSGESSQIFAKAGASRVIGIDVDAAAVESARSKYIEPGLEFCLGNGREIPMGDSLVDVFVCLETIEHVKEDKSFLDEVWRVLRPDGLLICSTPNRDVTNPDTVLEDSPWNHFHVREYNEVDFKRLIGDRFKIVGCFGQNPVHPIISRSSRMIAKIFGTRIAVKYNQGLKCRWFLFDAMKLHEVQKSSRIMEYFVWVMQK
jgi:ubiquinone/menaquinone biosynthesis C-methylase UbiE